MGRPSGVVFVPSLGCSGGLSSLEAEAIVAASHPASPGEHVTTPEKVLTVPRLTFPGITARRTHRNHDEAARVTQLLTDFFASASPAEKR